MNQFLKIILVIIFLVLNILYYDYHDYFLLHLIQGILECGGLALFAYYIINLDLHPSLSRVRLLIIGFLAVVFKNISMVTAKIMDDFYPVFTESYGDYLFIAALLSYALIIYYGIEKRKRHQSVL